MILFDMMKIQNTVTWSDNTDDSPPQILLVSLLLYTIPDLRRSLTMLLGSLPWTLMAYTPLLNLLILCHRHTQLSSGLHAAIIPWQYRRLELSDCVGAELTSHLKIRACTVVDVISVPLEM